MDTWVVDLCRQRCVRQLLAWAGVLAVGVLMAASQADYMRGFLAGPRAVTPSGLDGLVRPDGSSQFYVAVSGTRAIDTDIKEYSVKTTAGTEVSRSVKATFYALDVGDKFLIVKTSGRQELRAEGELRQLPAEFAQHFFETQEMRALRDHFYPVMLDTSSYRERGYWLLGIALVCVAFLLWKAVRLWKWLQDPPSHPLVARVAKWGDLLTTSMAVERELKEPRLRGGSGWTLTESYLVRTTYFGFDLRRFADLVWAYERVTKHSVNFIPTGKTYAAHLEFHDGSTELPGPQKRIRHILELAARRAPWAIFGYSDQLEALFRKRRDEFYATVEQRRAGPALG